MSKTVPLFCTTLLVAQLQMLLFPNALCCSLYERNCVCAVTKIFTKFLPANNFCQLLRVTRKRSCTSAGNAQAQLHFRDDQQRAFGISNISNWHMPPCPPFSSVASLICQEGQSESYTTGRLHSIWAWRGLKQPSLIFSTFSNFWRFWYHEKAHIFLITHGKFHSWKVSRLENINENIPGYGNHK